MPVKTFGWFKNSIPQAHWNMSKRPFMLMGALDSLSAAMHVLSSIYLPGTLLVLLPQAAIPFSMLASRWILRERFTYSQYSGAVIVFCGILVVLFPVVTQQYTPEYSCQALNQEFDCTICQIEMSEEECLSHLTVQQDDGGGDELADDVSPQEPSCQWISKEESLRHEDFLVFVWSLVMVSSCIPMTLSSVYKQVALSEHFNLDPIFVNGWVAVFQFLFSIPFTIPAALASSPSVKPLELPRNWWNAFHCLFGSHNSIDLGCHPDECLQAALWVHLSLLAAVAYTVAVVMMLKYGSSAWLYLALTVMVPLGHLVFAIHSPSFVQVSDVVGLVVLLAGLVLYRFGHEEDEIEQIDETGNGGEADSKGGYWLEFLREPFLLSGDV
jgi:drug/metabolite transporter (DMT)-like permease